MGTHLLLMLTLMLMTQAIHLLVYFKVSIEYTSILMLLTYLLISTTLWVTRVLHLMTLDCSTAHTFLYRWFVQLVRIHSNQKLDSRLATASSRTHSHKVQIRDLEHLHVTRTVTTEELKLLTLCKIEGYVSFITKTLLREGLFFSFLTNLNYYGTI